MEGEWLRRPKGDTSVVFIHGIFSSADKCWRNDNGAFWPDLLKKESNFKHVGIYLYSYKTGLLSGNYNLNDVVSDLSERLEKLDGVLNSPQVIFVCHSMGGIIIRKFLVDRINYFINPKIKIGLFFISTPSLGSYYANWLNIAARALKNSQADSLRFSEDNIWLNGLDTSFLNLYGSRKFEISGKELIEDESVSLKKFGLIKNILSPVVERFSGNRYFGEPYKVPNSNHITISTPENKKSIQHRILCDFINNYLSEKSKYISSHKRDVELLEKHLIAFNRSVFKYSCVYELNFDDMTQAIADTSLAINTGKLVSRHGPPFLIDQYDNSLHFETKQYIESFKEISSELQKLTYLVNALKHFVNVAIPSYTGPGNTYDILRHIKENCNNDVIIVYVNKMDEIDIKRNNILNILNHLSPKPKLDLIELSSSILKSGRMGGSGIAHLLR